jgi:hypothetical protein
MKRLSTMEFSEVMLILNIWSVETPRYLTWLQESGRATRGMPTSRKSQINQRPSTQRYLAGPSGTHPSGRPSFFDVKILGVQSRLAGLQEHTDLGRSRIQGAQLGWHGRRHTKILQDLGIKARRPQGGRFGVQMTNIAADHPAEP